VTAAAAGAAGAMPPDFRVSITNAPGANAYPISSFTWMLFYENPKDKRMARTMVDFFTWAITEGQKYCVALGYAPLPKEVVALEMAALKKIKL
jgi:phosphate transport system substrate-binding protein